MQRCIELAKNGVGFVSPNPMVGAVIVHNSKIIGEGWHKKYGEPHAEVNAINSVEDKALLKNSTIYVSLEPCSHHGKTPPCTDLIIKYGIPKVVIGTVDPYHKVSGRGIEKLRAVGVEVEVGICKEACEELNKAFFTSIKKKRPYVVLKWAETKDAYIDSNKDFDVKGARISNELSNKMDHKMRSEYDAIMVGTNTALIDNPNLNVRKWEGENPTRVVLDRSLRLPADLELFSKKIPSIIFNSVYTKEDENLSFVKIDFDNCVEEFLAELHKRKIQSIMIEGGEKLLNSIIEANMWDEAIVFIGDKMFEKGVPAPKLHRVHVDEDSLGSDKIFKFRNYC
jgi:diaminohydroxyphosphoribosylaminopyrimidine deaminase/5-amino-6-(5-phosphoribosylamino)uracil reductase